MWRWLVVIMVARLWCGEGGATGGWVRRRWGAWGVGEMMGEEDG